MKPNRRSGFAPWRFRKAVIFSLTSMLAGGIASVTSLAQGPPPTSQTSPEAAAEYVWSTILKSCTVPGEPGKTAVFFGDPQARDALYEFRGTWKKLFPQKLTEADRLNGVQYSGLAVLGFSANRYFSQNKWSPFDKGTADASWYTGANLSNRPRDKTNPSSVAITKRNGQWSFEVKGLLGLALGFGHGREFDPKSLSTVSIQKSCAELTSSNPFAAKR